MKVVVLWDRPSEKAFAMRLANMLRTFVARKHPNVEVTHESRNRFAPYRNGAESLAAEAQRLIDAQEAAFGESHADRNALTELAERGLRQQFSWQAPLRAAASNFDHAAQVMQVMQSNIAKINEIFADTPDKP